MDTSRSGDPGWLAARVAAALGLMVSFYALALAVAGGLIYLAYLDVTVSDRVHGKVVIFCVLGGLSVLWAIIPRPDRFDPPGPRVHPADEPALFKVLEEVAAATQQAMPSEVYMVNDVNAFVTQRGGIMGFGSRRVMGLGLPLMQALTIQEFKGVLAHEFGHYSSGDVGLGPWIYKTRAAIGRTIANLTDNILQKIFIWYGNMFLRVTHAISRRQEFVADGMAARTVGASVMMAALRKVRGAALAFDGYWHTELGVVIGSGYLPPITQGFARFLEAPPVAARVRAMIAEAEKSDQTDPFDTHPALGERLAALAAFGPGGANDDRAASSLLTHLPKWERRVLGTIVNDDWARGLKALDWDKVTDAVYVPTWRERVKDHGHLLAGRTIGSAPHHLAELVELGKATRGPDEQELTDEAASGRAWQLLIASIAVPLVEMGWTASTVPGEEVILRRDGRELRPYTELGAVLNNEVVPSWWLDRCRALGIADVPLGAGAAV
jgi:Zn-dependent protease with chaperone function